MQSDWKAHVRAALLRGDREALARLFAEAYDVEGEPAASHSWLEAVSAFDAEAVTG